MPFFVKEWGYRARLKVARLIMMQPKPRPAIYIGRDASLQLCNMISLFGLKNVLLVTDKPLRDLGILDSAVAALNNRGIEATIFDGVKPDPTVSVVRQGLSLFTSAGCDSVLAFGGGSSIDAAKVIALAASNNLAVEDCVGMRKGKVPAMPLFAIPTTAGTGSEATLAAVISDDETHKKLMIADPKIIPIAAALDPSIMQGLPAHITAATGMDALTHAIESFINTWETPETRYYGLAAARLIFNNLGAACADGSDLAAREAMALASYYAGLAFTTSLVGYVHAISHQLGGHYGVPHGLGNAMVLPHVLELLRDSAAERLAELAVYCELGKAGESQTLLAQKLIDRVWALNQEIGIPRTTDVIREADIDAIVTAALKEGATYPVPRFLDRRECEALVRGLQS